jgi:hypothetical protein
VAAEDMVFAFIPVLTLVGLFVLAALWLSRRARVRELVHRERLAMIEKGLIPPAELNPGLMAGEMPSNVAAGSSRVASRFRSAGIMLIGLGTAIALVIGVTAGLPTVGLGIGGAVAAIGAAMIVNSVFANRERADSTAAPVDVRP